MNNYHNLRAFADIHLTNLHQNLHNIKVLHPHKKVIVMLKANAYGHGAIEIAHALDGLCDYFGVASIEEGIELRDYGINTKIIIFSGFFCQQMTQKLINHSLIPIIHSTYQYELLVPYFKRCNAEIWLKVNTGMNRLGLNYNEFNDLYNKAQFYQKPLNALTHLAESENKDQSFTQLQLTRFYQLIQDKQLVNISAFNSAASLLNANIDKTNTIRIGLALYGACAQDAKDLGCTLHSVMSLHSHVIAIQPIKKGESVGYNRRYIAEEDTYIAIASIGYGDGYPQSTPNGTTVLINDIPYPTAGKVSMDLMAIEIGANHDIKIGDVVTLFGVPKLTVDQIAKQIGTSSYAILTAINPRVTRFYLD
ncbi:alanine racemase [Fastidiosibacter lacustris]|uniref:alanine racemase n=1 Tax=Fastidiosibacter lacustris TaxID=2056695 RepID=UPI000E3536B3|nr:alanine racemase [Fastidiosibacter lacustris]